MDRPLTRCHASRSERPLSGLHPIPANEAVKVVCHSLSLGCGRDDRTLVRFEDLQPAVNIAGCIVAWVVRDPQVRADEGSR
jgi:hypothetical protein